MYPQSNQTASPPSPPSPSTSGTTVDPNPYDYWDFNTTCIDDDNNTTTNYYDCQDYEVPLYRHSLPRHHPLLRLVHPGVADGCDW
ncbi:hypothetical protein Pmani_039798 [Petrolisthes manimaculis]|uniref:Uncharacterized protein n=1 Tax=Petrolisthes manimaculis TaxID=1843537 RepID=A0AAE1ND83_9EUCA|nr:hypothetical protein Pmani_039798 [Petrolisthes manimaculis]